MGLPMWKDPDSETIDGTVAKVEKAAATRRSTIRRETSVRPRENGSSRSISDFLRSRHQSIMRARDQIQQEDRETANQITQLQEELDRLRRIRLRNRARLGRELEMARAGLAAPQASTTNQSTQSEGPVQPTTSDESVQTTPVTEQGTSDTVAENTTETTTHHLPRPPRESNLRFEVLPPSSSRSSSPWRYQVLSRTTIPSPPHSAEGASVDRSVPDGPLPFDESPMPALTEGFAPAHTAPQQTSRNDESQPSDEYAGLETPPPELWEGSYPPLRRVSHMSPRPLPRVDGLGDRRRSSSSASEAQEEETWNNLLTTMNTGPSTTTTSFASVHSDSQARSGRLSYNTSFGEIGSIDDACDLDLPPGITEEDVLDLRAQHRPQRDEHRMTGRRGLQEHQDRIAGRVEVDMFRMILDRMQRREEIPDEWWATVGLSPDFGRS